MALILSSESINSETTAQEAVVENVLPSPDNASPPTPSSESDNVVSDKSSDTPTDSERTNFNKQEAIVEISKSDSSAGSDRANSEHEIRPEKIPSNKESETVTQQPQQQQQPPQTIEPHENVDKIPEQKVTTQKSSVDNV